jgi:hypothetical protein
MLSVTKQDSFFMRVVKQQLDGSLENLLLEALVL